MSAQRVLVHASSQRVRWGDMDMLGHVNNTVYFRFMEQARIEWTYALAGGQGYDGRMVWTDRATGAVAGARSRARPHGKLTAFACRHHESACDCRRARARAVARFEWRNGVERAFVA